MFRREGPDARETGRPRAATERKRNVFNEVLLPTAPWAPGEVCRALDAREVESVYTGTVPYVDSSAA